MIPAIVYALCAFTSAACAVLLLRGYFQSHGARLLLWSGLCFTFLTVNNILLFVDKVVLGPEIDLTIWRTTSVVVALAILLYGLIWDMG
jgi:hypothetical protein